MDSDAPKAPGNGKINLRRPDIMEAVQAQVMSHYRSDLVDHIRKHGHVLSADGLMTVKLAKEFGFCYGVERAIDLAYAARKVFPDQPIYILGEIIHNPEVNDQIRALGIKSLTGKEKTADIEDLKKDDVVIIPAFGTEVATRKKLSDEVLWIKNAGVSWQGDGFYYSRYPAPEKGKELTSKNEFQTVYFHKVGQPQAEDVLVYEDKEHPQRFQGVGTTEDERFAILSISERGKGKKGNSLFYKDLKADDANFSPIIAEIGDDSYNVIDNVDDKFLIRTSKNAPNGRVVLVDPKNPDEKNWKDVLPERTEPLQGAGTAGGKLFASWRKDVATRAYVFSLTGKLENEIQLPGVGTAGGFGGLNDDKYVFYNFSSFNFPSTIYKYDIATKKSSVFRTVDIPGFKPENYETKQVFYNSKDGTRVPLFLVYKKGLKLDGNNPTLLYGYGGFNVVTAPGFNSLRMALLEQGVVYASANMRGGGEYGEKWHEAGTKLKKQNVFDDFIAAAEWLIANKYTNSNKLAIQGASNGGLLVGAVSNQRPELFRVVIEQAGVMDMLRFHKFTIGWAWVTEYGSADSVAQFPALYRYSPIHNMKPGTKYPPTLVTTADHDDRVVPGHSFKYAATLQATQAGPAPVLIRIETKAGHGAGKPTSKIIEEISDSWGFLTCVLDMKVK